MPEGVPPVRVFGSTLLSTKLWPPLTRRTLRTRGESPPRPMRRCNCRSTPSSSNPKPSAWSRCPRSRCRSCPGRPGRRDSGLGPPAPRRRGCPWLRNRDVGQRAGHRQRRVERVGAGRQHDGRVGGECRHGAPQLRLVRDGHDRLRRARARGKHARDGDRSGDRARPWCATRARAIDSSGGRRHRERGLSRAEWGAVSSGGGTPTAGRRDEQHLSPPTGNRGHRKSRLRPSYAPLGVTSSAFCGSHPPSVEAARRRHSRRLHPRCSVRTQMRRLQR